MPIVFVFCGFVLGCCVSMLMAVEVLLPISRSLEEDARTEAYERGFKDAIAAVEAGEYKLSTIPRKAKR